MKNNSKKWIKDYIDDVDLNNVEWIILSAEELNNFFDENYLDKKEWEYVHDFNASSLYLKPIGMHYLNYSCPINNKDNKFLLGIVNNNIGKKTIVGATMYLDNYYIFTNQEKALTYISTMEVNKYFRNMGLYKRMCEALYNFVKKDQHIITTMESEMGLKCRVDDILKQIFYAKGFENYFIKDDSLISNSKLYDLICGNSKVLNKKRKEI